MKIYFLKIGCFLLLISILASCAVNPVTGQKELMLVSESREIEIGREFYPNALWGDVGGGGEFRDEKLKTYLGDIVMRVHSVSHRPGLPVKFAIQNSSVPNAWAIPGYVVMTRGLLAGLDSEAEFAFVMGHEIGHVAARHSARQMTYGMLQQIGLGATGLALSGSQYADAAINIGAIGSSLLLLKYGRDDELEADRLGIQYLARLGYDPDNAISSHRNLEKVANEYMQSVGRNPAERSFFEDLLSTHPRTSVRIEELRNMIAGLQPYHIYGDGTGREKFQSMTQGIRKTNRIYLDYYDKAVREFQQNNVDRARSLVSNAIEKDDRQPPFHALRGFIMLKKKEFADARVSFNNALAIDRDYQPAYRGLGALEYLSENYPKGIEHLKKGLAIFPQDVLSHYFLGMSYFRTKTYRSAIPHLNTFAGVKPDHPEIHGILGICYESIGDLSAAYNHYVMQVKVAPDNEMGRHASSRARALTPALQRQTR